MHYPRVSWGLGPLGVARPSKGGRWGKFKKKNIYIYFIQYGKGKSSSNTSNNKLNLNDHQWFITIKVKISDWGWPNVHYLDMGVAGQKVGIPCTTHYRALKHDIVRDANDVMAWNKVNSLLLLTLRCVYIFFRNCKHISTILLHHRSLCQGVTVISGHGPRYLRINKQAIGCCISAFSHVARWHCNHVFIWYALAFNKCMTYFRQSHLYTILTHCTRPLVLQCCK